MKRKPHRRLLTTIALALLAGALFVILGLDGAVGVSEYVYADARVPPAFDGLRIVQLSDYHNRDFGDGGAGLLETIARLEPDLILLTGDIIDRRNHNMEPTRALLEGVSAIAPCYFVSGNHELAPQAESCYATLLDWLRELDIVDLDDRSFALRSGEESILLHGQGYRSKYVDQYLPPADRGEFNLLLYHGGDNFDQIAPFGYDLVFAGHTHGGLVRLPGIGGVFGNNLNLFPRYDGGVFEQDGSTMVLSRGIGGPLRLYNSPEIVLVTLRHAD